MGLIFLMPVIFICVFVDLTDLNDHYTLESTVHLPYLDNVVWSLRQRMLHCLSE